jgi:hypothetical protein
MFSIISEKNAKDAAKQQLQLAEKSKETGKLAAEHDAARKWVTSSSQFGFATPETAGSYREQLATSKALYQLETQNLRLQKSKVL